MQTANLPVTASEILNSFQSAGVLASVEGNADTKVLRIAPIETAKPGDLVFVDKKDYVELVKARKPSVVVTSPKFKDAFSGIDGLTLLIAPNVPVAHALLKQRYAGRDYSRTGWNGVHASAIVHVSAEIDSSVVIEPNVVVGANVKIAKGCRIMAGAIIENDVTIDSDTIVQPLAIIGYGTKLGKEVLVGPGTAIGSEGYGFAQDAKRKSYPIPQTGIVVIEDRVRIGANCTIDRAAYQETRIGAGTKIDNLCHIAHNVQIGQDCLLTSMLCVAGSTKIGDRVITSGQTGIIDHMNVASDVVLLHRAGVTKDVEKPGAYAGLPLQPLTDYMKNAGTLKSAHELRQRIAKIEKHLGISED